VKDKVLGYRMDIQKEKDIAAIIAQARQQMARELLAEIDSHPEWESRVIALLIKEAIRKAGGV
jgi:hypothetical protein